MPDIGLQSISVHYYVVSLSEERSNLVFLNDLHTCAWDASLSLLRFVSQHQGTIFTMTFFESQKEFSCEIRVSRAHPFCIMIPPQGFTVQWFTHAHVSQALVKTHWFTSNGWTFVHKSDICRSACEGFLRITLWRMRDACSYLHDVEAFFIAADEHTGGWGEGEGGGQRDCFLR